MPKRTQKYSIESAQLRRNDSREYGFQGPAKKTNAASKYAYNVA